MNNTIKYNLLPLQRKHEGLTKEEFLRIFPAYAKMKRELDKELSN